MTQPVLYSFRRCPYAMRARLALAVAGIGVELREILLRNKPAAMLERSAKGTVPVLITTADEVIDESLDILRWALAISDPEDWRQADDAQTRALIAENDGPFKHWLDRYKYAERHPEIPPDTAFRAALDILATWEQRLKTHDGLGLLATRPTLADFALLPFVRQFAHSDRRRWADLGLPHLAAWLARFEDSPLFARIMPKWPVWQPGSAGILTDFAEPPPA
ncbi:MAG: glutathione S-transferase [Oceanococcaceae bacterium]